MRESARDPVPEGPLTYGPPSSGDESFGLAHRTGTLAGRGALDRGKRADEKPERPHALDPFTEDRTPTNLSSPPRA